METRCGLALQEQIPSTKLISSAAQMRSRLRPHSRNQTAAQLRLTSSHSSPSNPARIQLEAQEDLCAAIFLKLVSSGLAPWAPCCSGRCSAKAKSLQPTSGLPI